MKDQLSQQKQRKVSPMPYRRTENRFADLPFPRFSKNRRPNIWLNSEKIINNSQITSRK